MLPGRTAQILRISVRNIGRRGNGELPEPLRQGAVDLRSMLGVEPFAPPVRGHRFMPTVSDIDSAGQCRLACDICDWAVAALHALEPASLSDYTPPSARPARASRRRR